MTRTQNQALPVRDQLRRIIAGLADGVLAVEPDGSIAWANAKALAMHGVRSEEQLGGHLDEYARRFELRYRNGRRLDPVDYPASRALRGEVLEGVIVQVAETGGEPQWTHKVSSIAIENGAGEVDFIVLVLDDATDAFKAQTRFEKVFAANPAPAAICRLADQRFVKVNRGFLEMTGYHREAVIGKTMYELDLLERATHKATAVRILGEGGTIAPMEAELSLPGGGSKLVLVAGHPLEVDDEPCMLFSFVDLEDRRRAETALRQSEERFSCAFRLSPVPMVISSLLDRRILDANDAFTTLFKHDRSVAIGRSKAELKIWQDMDARGVVEARLEQTGSIPTTPVRLHASCGKPLDCLLSSQSVTIQGEPSVLTVMQDVTDQRRSDAQLLEAVEAVMLDSSWLGQKIVAKVNAHVREHGQPGQAAIEDLSARQREILALIAQGADDDTIATSLRLSIHTVRNHVTNLYKKLGIRKRADAVVWARERGVVNRKFEREISRNKLLK